MNAGQIWHFTKTNSKLRPSNWRGSCRKTPILSYSQEYIPFLGTTPGRGIHYFNILHCLIISSNLDTGTKNISHVLIYWEFLQWSKVSRISTELLNRIPPPTGHHVTPQVTMYGHLDNHSPLPHVNKTILNSINDVLCFDWSHSLSSSTTNPVRCCVPTSSTSTDPLVAIWSPCSDTRLRHMSESRVCFFAQSGHTKFEPPALVTEREQ